MKLFEIVKGQITAKEAAQHYGFSVNRSGMCRCPFHSDQNPSMKVDRRYHCFGCGADGDVIDFVSNVFGLSAREAAEKLALDFNLAQECKPQPRQKKSGKGQKDPRFKSAGETKKQESNLYQFIQDSWQHCWNVLCDYRQLLVDWMERYEPQPDDTVWHPLFAEACHKLNHIEYLLDHLWDADMKETADFILTYGKEVAEIEQRVEDIGSYDRAETENGNGYIPACHDIGSDPGRTGHIQRPAEEQPA